jgi:hypothetical protein
MICLQLVVLVVVIKTLGAHANNGTETKLVLRYSVSNCFYWGCLAAKNFQDFLSHRMIRHIRCDRKLHGLVEKPRDESFEPN